MQDGLAVLAHIHRIINLPVASLLEKLKPSSAQQPQGLFWSVSAKLTQSILYSIGDDQFCEENDMENCVCSKLIESGDGLRFEWVVIFLVIGLIPRASLVSAPTDAERDKKRRPEVRLISSRLLLLENIKKSWCARGSE